MGVQHKCLNCETHFYVPDDFLGRPEAFVQQGFVAADGAFQARGGYDLELVFHTCVGVPPPNRNVAVLYRRDDDDGSAGVPARPPKPLNDPARAMRREVQD
jgi:hypothetical protein